MSCSARTATRVFVMGCAAVSGPRPSNCAVTPVHSTSPMSRRSGRAPKVDLSRFVTRTTAGCTVFPETHHACGECAAGFKGKVTGVADKQALLRELAVMLATGPSGLSLAARLAQACVSLLQVDGASITIEAATPNRITLAVTDQIAAELEQLQDVLGQGPCWDAYLTGTTQTTDLSPVQDDRWPQFGPAARQTVGLRTVFGLPMQPQRQTLGVLSVHLADMSELPIGLEQSLFVADTVGAALLTDPQQDDPFGQGGPWSGRTQVHQATGIVIAQLRIPPADALAVLRAHAYAHETGLDDIAEQILRGTLTFGTDNET
jgi:hypothetical protein